MNLRSFCVVLLAFAAACGDNGSETQQQQLTAAETQRKCGEAIVALGADPALINCPDVAYSPPVRCPHEGSNCCNPDALADPVIAREAGAAYNEQTNVIYATQNFGAPCNTVETQIEVQMCAAVRCQARHVCPSRDDLQGIFRENFTGECAS